MTKSDNKIWDPTVNPYQEQASDLDDGERKLKPKVLSTRDGSASYETRFNVGQMRPEGKQKQPAAVDKQKFPEMKSKKAPFCLVTWLGLLNAKEPVLIKSLYPFVKEYFPGHVTSTANWQSCLRESVFKKTGKGLFVKLDPSEGKVCDPKEGLRSFWTIKEGSRSLIDDLLVDLAKEGINPHNMGLKNFGDWKELLAGTKGLPADVPDEEDSKPPVPPKTDLQKKVARGHRFGGRHKMYVKKAQAPVNESPADVGEDLPDYWKEVLAGLPPNRGNRGDRLDGFGGKGRPFQYLPTVVYNEDMELEELPRPWKGGTVVFHMGPDGEVKPLSKKNKNPWKGKDVDTEDERIDDDEAMESEEKFLELSDSSEDEEILKDMLRMLDFDMGPEPGELTYPNQTMTLEDFRPLKGEVLHMGLDGGMTPLPAETQKKSTKRRASPKTWNGPPDAKKLKAGRGGFKRMYPEPRPMCHQNLPARAHSRPRILHQPRTVKFSQRN